MKGIIGIKSWKRAGKDLLGAYISVYMTENVKQGFGNVHIFETPYLAAAYRFSSQRNLFGDAKTKRRIMTGAIISDY